MPCDTCTSRRLKRILAVGALLMLGLIAWYVEIEYGILERFRQKKLRIISTPRHDLVDTPMGLAALKGDTGELKRLLASGMPVDIPDKGGQTALSIAAGMNQTDAALVLLENGANPNAPTGGAGPLYWAAKKGNLVLVSALLKRGADPNSEDIIGSTPIFDAVLEGQEETVELLLNSGARPAIRDRWGETPLSLAEIQLVAARKSDSREDRKRAQRFERIITLLKARSESHHQ